jgi:N-acetylglutamate synthase/N-acetylornithine aminotransferase
VDDVALGEAVRGTRVRVSIDLGRGEATARWTTTDLTHEYVTINAEYTT